MTISSNNLLNTKIRPTSPHLTIYKPQITSVLSILHRITGVAFLLGLLIFCWFVILQSYNVIEIKRAIAYISDNIFCKILVLLWLYCSLYHLFNGVRYLLWSFGIGFDLKNVTVSGTIAIIGSMFLLFLIYFLTLG